MPDLVASRLRPSAVWLRREADADAQGLLSSAVRLAASQAALDSLSMGTLSLSTFVGHFRWALHGVHTRRHTWRSHFRRAHLVH